MQSDQTLPRNKIRGSLFRVVPRSLRCSIPENSGEQAHHSHGQRCEGEQDRQQRQQGRGWVIGREDGHGAQSHECQLKAYLCVKDS